MRQLPTEVRSKLLDRGLAASTLTERVTKRGMGWARRDSEIESGTSIVVSEPELLAKLRAELE